MSIQFTDKLQAARHEHFVGRAVERELFRFVLTADNPPFRVVFVYGEGGVGKTSLLREFAHICQVVARQFVQLDGRNIEPSPDLFLEALNLRSSQKQPKATLASLQGMALLIDNYELLASLDAWLREVFLPQTPEDLLVVLAGRNPPSPQWRADPGWRGLIHSIPLSNLSPEESRDFLSKRGVPDEQYQAILEFTHGHPLALSLVADTYAQRTNFAFQPEAAPDVVKILVEQLVQRVPSPAHRTALEASAIVRSTTEGLLAEMLALPDAYELFQWLRELSFMESGPLGLSPHDLAREALVAEVRWRNPDWYAELHRRARAYYRNHLLHSSGHSQQRVLFDYIFLHRDNPMVRPFFAWQAGADLLADTMKDTDIAFIKEMVARHEGEESARLAEFWLQRQPQGVLVFRDAQRQPAGFLDIVALQQASPEEINHDPATKATWTYLESHAPLRPGEAATLIRFWMAKDTYQNVSPIQSLITVNVVKHYFAMPGLAFTFLPCANPDFWNIVFIYADLSRLREADFEVGGRRYGVFGHDWRVVPPIAWLELLAQREIGGSAEANAAPAVAPRAILSRQEFSAAVRDALRHFTRPTALQGNPLLRCRLVIGRTEAGGRSETPARTLQAIISEAAETLRQSVREERFYLALYHTYLHPAPSQEQAAEILDLPFSTFRRHLAEGIERLTAILWQQEVGAAKN